MRKLSERIASATKEISELIEEFQAIVDLGDNWSSEVTKDELSLDLDDLQQFITFLPGIYRAFTVFFPGRCQNNYS